MAGYTRTDTANNIANGNVINANDLDGEYNAVEAAFNASSGHTHDGTAAEGAPITKVGPSQDLVISSSTVLPKTTNTLDLGSSTVQFKDGYFDGVLYADSSIHGVNGFSSIADNVYAVSSGGLTFDVVGDITLDAASNDVVLASNGTTFGTLTNTSSNLTIKSGTTTAITLTGANTQLAGTLGVTGNITVGGTVDGQDLAVMGTKLAGIENGATADQNASEIRTLVEAATDSNVFTDADHTKLNSVESNADVTDATNVTAAGALMDSEVTNLAQVKAFSSSDYATATRTVSAGAGLTGGGDLTTNRTISHADTSSQASVDNSGQNFIQDITLDAYGHITAISSAEASGSSGLVGNGTETASFTTLEGNLIRAVDNGAPQIKSDDLTNTQSETPVMLGQMSSGYYTPKTSSSLGSGITFNNGTGSFKVLNGMILIAENKEIRSHANSHSIIFADDSSSNGGAGNKEIRFEVGANASTSRLIIEGTRTYIRDLLYVYGSSSAVTIDTPGIVRGASFSATSDYRLKENIDYTWDATTRLKQLKPARYNWIADETNTLVDGFIAHEVSAVVPDAVHGAKDGDEMQSLDYSKMIPLLVKTIQELEARIVALES